MYALYKTRIWMQQVDVVHQRNEGSCVRFFVEFVTAYPADGVKVRRLVMTKHQG